MSTTLDISNSQDKVRRVVDLISINRPYVTVLGHDSLGEYAIESVLDGLGCGKPLSIHDISDLKQLRRDRRIEGVLGEGDGQMSEFVSIRVEKAVSDSIADFVSNLGTLSDKIRRISRQAREEDVRVVLVSRVYNSFPQRERKEVEINLNYLTSDDQSFVGGKDILYQADLAIVAKDKIMAVVKNRYGHDGVI